MLATTRGRATVAVLMFGVVLRELSPVPPLVGGVLCQVRVAMGRRRTIRTHLDRAGDRQ